MTDHHEIPDSVKSALELAATKVLQLSNEALFIGDRPVAEMTLSVTPKILLRKTGGTTGHRERGENYFYYRLSIPDVKIRYSIYVKNPTDILAKNRRALARAIMWFIGNYGKGTVVSRDEPTSDSED